MWDQFWNSFHTYEKISAQLSRGCPDVKGGFYAKHKKRRTMKKKTKGKRKGGKRK